MAGVTADLLSIMARLDLHEDFTYGGPIESFIQRLNGITDIAATLR